MVVERLRKAARTFVNPALVILLVILIVGAAAGVGGAHNGVVLVLGAVAVVAAITAGFHPTVERRPSLAPGIILAVLAVYSMIQTVPLPLTWVERLSPAAADIWVRSLIPVGRQVDSATLSLDPSATTLEGLKWATYAVVFRLACLVARRQGAATVMGIVFASSVLVAMATVGHELSGARKVWGIYQPRSAFEFARVGPFLNPNNLAGYLNLGALSGLGLLQQRRPSVSPWIVGAGVAIVVAVAFRSASRGAVLALPIGVLITGILVLVARYGKRQTATQRFPIWPAYAAMAGAVAMGVGFAFLAADEAFWRDLLNTNTEKLVMSSWTRPVIFDYPFFGIGRGSFESVFLAYRPEVPSHAAFIHPENFVAQWVSEWGLLVGGGAIAGLVWGFRPWNIGASKSALNAAGFSAVTVVLLQNLLDLGLELPGIALSLVAILGALWGDLRVRRPVRSDSTALERVYGFGLVGLVSTALLLSWARGAASSLSDDREHARELLEEARRQPTRRAEADQAIEAGMLRHPADYYFPLLGALSAMESGEASPMPWLQRALERGPNVGRTHLLLAEVLFRGRATKQGMLELRLAVEFEPGLAVAAGQTAVRHSEKLDELLAAAAPGPAGARTLESMAAAVNVHALRESLDREALERDPTLVQPRERIARARLDALAARDERCWDSESCVLEVVDQAEALASYHPRSSRGAQLEALLNIQNGEPDLANTVLIDACRLPLDAVSCLELHARVASAEALPEIFERHASFICSRREACAASWDWAAVTYAGRGYVAQAYGAARAAAEQVPTVERWLAAASYAEQSQNRKGAINALEQAIRRGGDEGALRSRIAQLRLSP